MVDNKHIRCELDSPDRCQAVGSQGQCRYQAIEGAKNCLMHGGSIPSKSLQDKSKRAYQLAKWQDGVDSFADEDQVKSLRGEIGISRLLLETMITRCQDAGELLLFSNKIADLVSRIEKLVVACHRLESNLGMMLDKPRIMMLATQIVEIITQHVEDPDAVAAISDGIITAIVKSQGAKEK